LAKDECIKFPAGSYQTLYDGVSYKIDPENDIVEMTEKLNPRYSLEGKEEATNLVNELGVEKVQKNLGLFSKLLFSSMLLFPFLMFLQAFSSAKSEPFLSWGRFLTVVSEIAFLYLFAYYKLAMNYYKDSYCEKCGKHLVFEEFQAPLIKHESKTDGYTKTFTAFWRCKNCGYEDIKVEPQYVDHHHEIKKGTLEDHRCEECGKEHAIEEYRKVDVLRSVARKKIRYFKCAYCGYHEIKLDVKLNLH
jgi:hypothetical protein